MENVSNIKLNILMEKLYLESAVNQIFQEASDFDWVSDVSNIDLTFDGEHEYWVDINGLDDNEKNWVMDFILKHHVTEDRNALFTFRRRVKTMCGIVVHCGDEENDYIPQEGVLCTMSEPFEDDDQSHNSIYINGKDLIPQVTHNRMNESEENEDKDPSVLKDVINDLNLSKSFIFTFGTGIGAFMGPVTKLLEGSGVHFTTVEITLLVVTALAMMLNQSNTDDAVKKLKEEGLHQYLDGVKGFISDTHKMMNSILKTITNATYGLADILGFTFILVPAMNVLTGLITDYGTSFNSVGQLMLGLGAASVSYAVKSVLRKLKRKL